MRKWLILTVLIALLVGVVGAQAPAVPAPLSPVANVAISKNAFPIFRWSAAAGATSYRIKVFNSANVVVLNIPVTASACSGSVCAVTSPTRIRAIGNYRWQVFAFNSSGSSRSARVLLGIYPNYAVNLLNQVNAERCSRGLAPLAMNLSLFNAARRHTNDMTRNSFVSHTGSDGTLPWDRFTQAGYNWTTAAENIAGGYTTAADVFSAWMSSSGHRANMLDSSMREMGVFMVNGLWTQTLAARSSGVLGTCP